MREVKETGWGGGGQNPVKLSRAEVQVSFKYFFFILGFFQQSDLCFRLFLTQRMQSRMSLRVTLEEVVSLIVSNTLRYIAVK